MDINMESMDNSTIPQRSDDWILMNEHRRLLYERIPLIVFLSLITVCGIFGNILTIIFYTRRAKQTPTVLLIKYLAVFDLIVCFLAITTITDLAVNILYTYGGLCKVMYFLDHWFVVTSVFIICAIAIDRYRKMCKPFGKQFTNRSAFWTVVALSTISMAVSTHDFVTYDIVHINITSNVTGHYCTNTDDENFQTVVVIFHALDACTILMSFLTFITMYGSIWYNLRKHNKSKIASKSNHSSGTPLRNATHSTGLSLDAMSTFSNNETSQSRDRVNQSIESLQIESSNQIVRFNLGESDDKMVNISSQNTPTNSMMDMNKKGKRTKASNHSQTEKSEGRITIMMFAITVAFSVCFIPYFIVIVYIRLLSKETEKELSVLVEFALRSPFWNSVINPIIFCVFNSQYRQYVKNIFTKCKII